MPGANGDRMGRRSAMMAPQPAGADQFAVPGDDGGMQIGPRPRPGTVTLIWAASISVTGAADTSAGIAPPPSWPVRHPRQGTGHRRRPGRQPPVKDMKTPLTMGGSAD